MSEIAIEFSAPPTVRKSVVSLSESGVMMTLAQPLEMLARTVRGAEEQEQEEYTTRFNATFARNKKKVKGRVPSCRRLLHLRNRDFHVFRPLVKDEEDLGEWNS